MALYFPSEKRPHNKNSYNSYLDSIKYCEDDDELVDINNSNSLDKR